MTFEQKCQFEIIRQTSENWWSNFDADFSSRFTSVQKEIDKELNAASDDAYAAMFDE